MPEASPDGGAELPATFGKYFLTEKLATGGMAEIYLGKLLGPNGFEKQLVIKQIHPRFSGQRQFVDLFVAEAKILVTLAHGNIVPVYELGVVDDTYFIAMEYIDGPTLYRLTEVLAGKGAVMPPPLAAWITARVLDGLDYAHRKGDGVIHRDLSPRNVMLSRDGEVKLVDFGIAVGQGELGAGEATAAAPTGSFPYMSPEQVRREALTGQSDLFSAGVLAWEMLVGRRLFARGEAEATLAAVEGANIPRPSELAADVPAKLDEVVMRALERDRGARWESAGDMLAALNRYLYALEETPGPRDVAALVARYCPPETRRLPTHAEAFPEEAGGGDTNGPQTTPAAPPPPEDPVVPSGPRTAVIPRRKRAPTRQQSFATHVVLDELLEAKPEATAAERADPTVPVTPAPPPPPPRVREANERPPGMRSGPPSSMGLVLGGIAAIGLGAAAVFVFVHGRDAVMRPDAMPKHDAAFYAIFGEAGVPDAAPAADANADADADADAPTTDAAAAVAVVDAAAPIDARPRVAADAGARPDAAVHAVLAGTATLKIGADPWGDIVIDGVARGRTPAELAVPAGHHSVQLIYRGEDPPMTKTFSLDLGANEVHPIQADFRGP